MARHAIPACTDTIGTLIRTAVISTTTVGFLLFSPFRTSAFSTQAGFDSFPHSPEQVVSGPDIGDNGFAAKPGNGETASGGRDDVASIVLWHDWRLYAAALLALLGSKLMTGLRDKSLRKRLDLRTRALLESEERLYLLSEMCPSGVAILKGRALMEANARFYRMFGHPPEELLGRDILSVIIAPDEWDRVQERNCLDRSCSFETGGVRRDGSVFPMELNSRRISCQGENVAVIILADISTRKRQESERDCMQERLLSLWNVARMTEATCDELCRLILK